MPQRQLPRAAHLEDYRKLRFLGRGSEGPNWLCERRSDKKLVVLKSYDWWVKYDGRPLEALILRQIVPNHPRILYCNGWCEFDNNRLEVYYDYCRGGDLADFMAKHAPHGRCHESFICHVFMQIADALALLRESKVLSIMKDHGYRRDHPNSVPSHWQSVVHRDVKPANIFFRKRYALGFEFPPLVLGDFGIATLHPTTNEGVGTPFWQGPERPLVTAKTDIWGLGAIIHALAHGHAPQKPAPPEYRAAGEEGMRAWHRSSRSKSPKALTTRYSQELSDNMMRCLVWDAKDRVDSKSLVKAW